MTPSIIGAKYLGQTEKAGNMGFNDPEFEKKMIAVGFHKRDSWCSYFQEMIHKEAYPERLKELDRLFSANSYLTFHNFKAAGHDIREGEGMMPAIDWLVVWQQIKDGVPVNRGTEKAPIYPGHIGIVCSVNQGDPLGFWSIEGNTSSAGVREGYIVNKNPHRVVHDVKNGKKILGFVKV